ncbi:MAG: hypothetical protein AMS27_14955 [Bacteroides sp. SM23_62_1]|nr:MAG: hypothetical protein AMS27_14955 [Bacteroides sp. SM23_62_1]
MKAVSIISIVYGTMGFIWSSIVLVGIGIQKAILENVPFPEEVLIYIDIPKMIEVIHGIMLFLMPFVFIIAAVYIVSGILGLSNKSQAYMFGILAAVFNIFWYVAYVIILQMELVPLFNFNDVFPEKLFNLIFLLGTIINAVFYCGYPIFLIIYLSQQRKQTS